MSFRIVTSSVLTEEEESKYIEGLVIAEWEKLLEKYKNPNSIIRNVAWSMACATVQRQLGVPIGR